MQTNTFGFSGIQDELAAAEKQHLQRLLQSLEKQLGTKSTATSLAFAQTLD